MVPFIDSVKEAFKSKEQKEREAEEKKLMEQVRLRRSVQSMKKFDKSLDRKKNEMIQRAQEAKQQGLNAQYNQARNAVQMILKSQNQCRSMAMQLEIMQTMQEITDTTGQFFQTIGEVGQQLDNIVKGMNLAGNQLEFDKGMIQAQRAMDQLDQCLESTGMAMDGMVEDDDELTKQVDDLINMASAGNETNEDEEINKRLAELKKKQSGLA